MKEKFSQNIFRFDESEEYYFREGCYILEMFNSDKDETLSIARVTVHPGRCTRWHRLKGTTERYLILEGQGEVEIGDEPPVSVGKGDVVMIPEGYRQRIKNITDNNLVFLAICTPRFKEENYEDLDDSDDNLCKPIK